MRYMADEVADDGGEARAGDYVISYAVEEAEGMYDWVDGALVWQDPGETTTHVEVAVRDAGDGRFVPGAKVTVTMISPDGTEVGTEHHPLLWHPMVYHYGRNWQGDIARNLLAAQDVHAPFVGSSPRRCA